jgi:hypothetical protein
MANKKKSAATTYARCVVPAKTPTKPAPRLVQKPPVNLVGLIAKYLVFKKEWTSGGERWVQKETACFVLSPDKPNSYGAASCKALLAYARAIKKTNPRLSQDLRDWVAAVECGRKAEF